MKDFLDGLAGHRTFLLVAFVLVLYAVTGVVLAFTKSPEYYTETLGFLSSLIVNAGIALGASKGGTALKTYAAGGKTNDSEARKQ